jgi:ABC-type amino acid transport substrate-binding protein
LAIAEANDGLTTAPKAVSDEEKYAIAVNKDNEKLLKSINSTLERLMKEGKIEAFLVKHTGGAK